MLYLIFARDAENSLAQRAAARPAHLARLHQLRDEARLHLAGPLPAIDNPDPGPAGFLGSAIIAEFASLEEAKAWAQDDPYLLTGVYQSVDVFPFKKVLP